MGHECHLLCMNLLGNRVYRSCYFFPTYPPQSVMHWLCFINKWHIWKYIVHISCMFSIRGMLNIQYHFVNWFSETTRSPHWNIPRKSTAHSANCKMFHFLCLALPWSSVSPCRAHAVLRARCRHATPRRGGVGASGHSALATLPLTSQQLRGERAANGAPRRGVCMVSLPGECRTQARQLGMTRRGWRLGRVASEYQFLGGKKTKFA